jgi:hypothetical protein
VNGSDSLPITSWLLWIVFGATTTLLIDTMGVPGLPRLELLGLAGGSAAMLTALVWFAVLGARRSPLWLLALLVPYVNLIAASRFARKYWNEGARAPALLALAGFAVQTAASLRVMLVPNGLPLV